MYNSIEILLKVPFKPIYYIYLPAKLDLNVNILIVSKDPLDTSYNQPYYYPIV